MDRLKIGNQELSIKEYQEKRVITFKDIDTVHERPEGTAKRNFVANQKHFIEGDDYFIITKNDVGTNFVLTYGFSNKAPKGLLLTESGYLMLVKSFTDDLAWTVQRQLVNIYFRFKQVVQDFNQNYPIDTNELNKVLKNMPALVAQINNVESMLEEQNEILADQTKQIDELAIAQDQFLSEHSEQLDEHTEKLEVIIDNLTLSTRQQEKIHETARKRVNYLLGGAHTPEYKKNSRMYFINLWNKLKEKFHCGSSWKDLNPVDFDGAVDFIKQWKYVEN